MSLWLSLALALCRWGVAASEEAHGNQAARAANESLHWDSLIAGLLWYGIQDLSSFNGNGIRHECTGNEIKYDWTEHDGRSWARQILQDPRENWEIATEFIKFPGGIHGGSWAARIKGEPIDSSRLARSSFVFYAGLEGTDLLKAEAVDPGGFKTTEIWGSTADLGKFTLRFEDKSAGPALRAVANSDGLDRDFGKLQFWGVSIPKGNLWRIKEYLIQTIIQRFEPLSKRYQTLADLPDPAYILSLPNTVTDDSNVFLVQKSVENAPFELLITFESQSVPSSVSKDDVIGGLDASAAAFRHRFEETFPLKDKGFNAQQRKFAQEQLTNILGGVGFFHGESLIDRGDYDTEETTEHFWQKQVEMSQPALYPPSGLFTATPSRSFFPRGFLWDEGFHQLIIGEWDNDLSLAMIHAWTQLIDEDGWIAREQILGDEARSRVPQEFQTQFRHYANPPTLILAVSAFLDRLERAKDPIQGIEFTGQTPLMNLDLTSSASPITLSSRHLKDPILAQQYLHNIYSKLRLNWQWFRKTQRGDVSKLEQMPAGGPELYRWRGRTPDHCLTSGLDDYPRAQPPSPGELHVDLLSWMGFYTQHLSRLAEWLSLEEDQVEYNQISKDILKNLLDVHWSKRDQAFCDVTVDDFEEGTYVCHKGYISVLPLVLGLLPVDAPQVGATIDLMLDRAHLWSDHGLCSLSKADSKHGTGENYWRGPIWLPINYLALQAMHRIYARHPGPHQDKAQHLYTSLRANLIRNTFSNWEETGAVWEQYDCESGRGQRTQSFTGWSALILLIMAERY